jgi:O-antigen/teichoic acid export membrane protein
MSRSRDPGRGARPPDPAPLASRLRAALRSRTARDSLTNVAGTAASVLLSFGVLLIATNVLGPSGFGQFAVALAVLMMASELSDLGVNAGLIRHASVHLGRGDAEAARTVLSVALRAKIGTAAAGGLAVAALAAPLADLLGRPAATPLLRIAALGLAGAVLLGYASAVLQAQQRFRRNAALQAIHWGLRLAGAAGLALSGGLSPTSLLWVHAVSPWLAFAIGLAMIPRGEVSLRRWDRRRARELFAFSRWMGLWAVFWILLTRVDLLIVGALASDDQVGYYGTSQRVIALVTLVVNAYVMTLAPKLSRLEDRAALAGAVRDARWVSRALAAAVALGIPLSFPIVRLFGAEFGPAAPVLALMLAGSCFWTLTLPWTTALYALDRPQAFALSSGLGLLISVAGNLWLVPSFGARGAGAVAAVVGVEQLAVAVLAARRHLRRPGEPPGSGPVQPQAV